MFRKLYPKVRIRGGLRLDVPRWVINKKVITNNNTQLPHNFNTVQLHTPDNLDLNERWK